MWEFELSTGVTLKVHRGSGHWSSVLDTNKMQVTKSVYVYEATSHHPDGTRHDTPILAKTLRLLRKKAREAQR